MGAPLESLNRKAPVIRRALCLLGLTVLAVSLMGSTVTLCGPGCYAADLSGIWGPAEPHYRPSWSADGTRIAFFHYRDIYVVASDGSFLKRAAKRDGGLEWFKSPFSPNISPDGSRIAYVQNSDSCKANLDIFVSNIDGSHRQRLTEHVANDTNPVWSPDGARIAFLSDRDPVGNNFGWGTYAYFTMNADGSGIRRVSGPESLLERVPPVWSPDSIRLAFVAKIGEQKRVPYSLTPLPTVSTAHNAVDYVDAVDYVVQRHVIYTVGADGSDLGQMWAGTMQPGYTPRLRSSHRHISVPEESIGQLRWSPDGTTIAFDSKVYGEPATLNLLKLDGSQPLQVANPRDDEEAWVTPLFWSSDSSTVTISFGSRWVEVDRYVDHIGIYEASLDGQDTKHISKHGVLWGRDWSLFSSSFTAHKDMMALHIPYREPNYSRDEVLITTALDGSDRFVLVKPSGNGVKAVKRD